MRKVTLERNLALVNSLWLLYLGIDYMILTECDLTVCKAEWHSYINTRENRLGHVTWKKPLINNFLNDIVRMCIG